MIDEQLRDDRKPENGSGGRPLAVTEGIVWSLGRLQRIESEAVNLFETSAKSAIGAAGEVTREALSALGQTLRLAASESGEVGGELSGAFEQLVRRFLESGLEVTKGVIDFARGLTEHTIGSAGRLGGALLRVNRDLAISAFESTADVAAATFFRQRSGPAIFPPPGEEGRTSSGILEMAT